MELDSEGLDSQVEVPLVAWKETSHNNDNGDDYEVEKITGMRLVKGKLWFRVRWKGYGADTATWEPRVNLTHCEELLDDYVSKVQDKKYKQKKRRQTRNALIHTRKREQKDDDSKVNHVIKNKVTLTGDIMRKRIIKKFISKPNKFFNRTPQTKWPMDESQLDMASTKGPEELPLETMKERESTRERRRRRRRGRGRPKKNPTKMPDLQPQTQSCQERETNLQQPQTQPCPEREPLETVDDIILLDDNSVPEQTPETTVKRGRGRPPKKKTAELGEKSHGDLCRQERSTGIRRKRGRPRKGVVSGGVTKATTCDPYNGQIKLKKVVIRELRSLKALLEFQRQISDEEKENQTDTYHKKEGVPSSLEHRHVLASETGNRFFIRIKTGKFKDLSTKRRRKRKADKEKRRKKRKARQMLEQTEVDKGKSEPTGKENNCLEVEEDGEECCPLPEVVEICSSSEPEKGDEDSVESQKDPPALNEEYDQFGYDDDFDFSRDTISVKKKSKTEDTVHGDLQQVSAKREIGLGEVQMDETDARKSSNLQDVLKSREENLAEEDVFIDKEKMMEEDEEEEEAAAGDDESSSLVIPFDEDDEDSSSLIIADDGMEVDDDDDDDDDLREFDIGSEEIQDSEPIASPIFTGESVDKAEQEVVNEVTRGDKGQYEEAGHCHKSSEDTDSDEFLFEEKSNSKATDIPQELGEERNLHSTSRNDFSREEAMSEVYDGDRSHSKNHKDIPSSDGEKDDVGIIEPINVHFTEDSSEVVKNLEIYMGIRKEYAQYEETESEEPNSGSTVVRMEPDEAEKSMVVKDEEIKDSEPMEVKQTPNLDKCMEEEDSALELMTSDILSKTKKDEADDFVGNEEGAKGEMEGEDKEAKGGQIEPQVAVLSEGKEMEGEAKDDDRETESASAEGQKELTAEKGFAVEIENSDVVDERTDNSGSKEESCVERMKENCEDIEKHERETNNDLNEPQVTVLSKGKDREVVSELVGPRELLEEEMLKGNHTVEMNNTQLLPSKKDGETHDVGRKEDRCVEKSEEEFDKEANRKSKDDLIEPQVMVLSKTKELHREVQADDKQTESVVTGTKESTEKATTLEEEMEHENKSVDVPQTDRITTEESDKNDDQRKGEKEKTNKDHEKIEAFITDAQENRDKQLKTNQQVEHKEHVVPQRGIETLESELKQINERENKVDGNQQETCDEKIEDNKKERETEGRKSKEQVACDGKMEENIEEKREQVIVLSNGKEIEEKAQTEEVEMETAVAVETLERELRLDEEMEDERSKTPQRDNDKMKPDRTPLKVAENAEYDDRRERDKEQRRMDDEEMEFENAGTNGIVEKEMHMVEGLDNEENKMHQRDILNLIPDLNITKEEQDRKKKANGVRIPEAICNLTGDNINIEEKEEMEVEEKEDGQIDSETITPEEDKTRHQEGDDAVAMVNRADKKMMFTSTEENLKDQRIMTEDSQEDDKECNSTEEAAVTVTEEKRMEYIDNQEEGVQGIPDLEVKHKGDVGCGKVECSLEKMVVVEPEEAKTTCVGKEILEEVPERDGVDNSQEATTTEISPGEDNLHAVEEKGNNKATGQKGFNNNLEGTLKSNCTKINNNIEDNECITNAKTKPGNELMTEKGMGEELIDSHHDNMDGKDDALLNAMRRGEAEENKGHGAEIESIDEGFTDDKENKCHQNTPTPSHNEARKAENKTNGNSGYILEDASQEEMEVSRKTISGSSGSDPDVALQEKVKVDIDESKARDVGDRDKTTEDEGLEEGEIPEDEEDEEEKEDGVVVTIDENKEEGEITEVMEDAGEERGRIDEGEEMTLGLTDRSKVIGQNVAKEWVHSQNKEQLRRRKQEVIAILETSTINSDHQTTQCDGEKTRTNRSSASSVKRNLNGAYLRKERIRSKTLKPFNSITVDNDDDEVEVVEPDIPSKTVGKHINEINSLESDVYIIDDEPAKCAERKLHNHRTKIIEQTNDRTLKSKENPEALSPKFGNGLKKVSPTSSSRVSKVDKNGSNARRMVQSMKAHVQHTFNNSRKLEKNGKAVVKNSACKAQAFRPKDSPGKDSRLEGAGSSDGDIRADKGGTKRKSDDDDDSVSGSRTCPKKKQVGASGKEVWQMVTRKEKKPTEPIWEGNTTKINRQKIVIKISKIRLTDLPETKEPENNAKRKSPEKPLGQHSWKEGMRMEVADGDRGFQGGMKANGVEEEPKEKQEKTQVNGRGGKTASTSMGAAGRWSTLPKANSDKETIHDSSWKNGRESRTNSRYPSDDLLKDLKELKAHGIKQSDLPWVKDLLETDHTECLSEVCAALTKFMDSKDQKINLVVEMGFCPLLVKLLRSPSPEVISSALLAVSHIVSGNDYQTQAVLECSPLPLFCCFLSRHKHDVTLRKEACLALSNITAGTSQQIQHLVNDGLFPVLLSAMQHDDFQVMYEATWAVANATVNGSPEQIRYIVKQGFFQAFSEVLKQTDDTLIQIALDAMYNVLKLDEKHKKAGKPTPYCRQVKEFGGLERIRSVRLTGSTVVKKKSYNMLTTFFTDF